MKMGNWTNVDVATMGGSKLPAGGYVIKVQKVEDDEKNEFLNVVYDIAEGEHAGHYSDDFAKQRPYIHSFRRYYRDSAAGYFAQFLHAMEESTPNFSIESWQRTCNPFELEGNVLGAIFQNEHYTNTRGEDKERLNLYACVPAQVIREGRFEVPAEKDSRTSARGDAYGYNPYRDKQGTGSGDPYAGDDSLPFS